MRVLDLCLNQCWAITPEALEVILAIAARDDIPARAVEAVAGRPLDNTRSVSYRNGVAIIPIEGSIVRHGDLFSEVSGAVSVNSLAKDFTTALNDNSVQAILFAIDSPGGEVNGIAEFADMIFAGRAAKPIKAYISSLGASAAYWLASACDEIVANATAQVGSIGVVGTMPNPAKDAQRTIEFVSSQSPDKRPDISTDRGRAQIQARVDALADVFVATVARNRDVTEATVLSDFGGGGIFVGKDAVLAGLIDRIGSFESVLAELATPATVPRGLYTRPGASAGPSQHAASSKGADHQASLADATAQKESRDMAAEDKDPKDAQERTEAVPAVAAKAAAAPQPTATATSQDDPRVPELMSRISALEASEASATALATAATARVQALEVEARRRDLAVIAAGFVNASVDEHVAFMEALEPKALEFYVRQQRAAAEQQAASTLFSEAGRAGTTSPGSPTEQLNALVNARVKEAGLDRMTASMQIAAEHPDLIEAHNKAVAVRV